MQCLSLLPSEIATSQTAVLRVSFTTDNRRGMVRLANHVTKYVIVHFLFWSCDQ